MTTPPGNWPQQPPRFPPIPQPGPQPPPTTQQLPPFPPPQPYAQPQPFTQQPFTAPQPVTQPEPLTQQQPYGYPQYPYQPPAPPAKPRRTLLIVGIVAAALLLIVAIGGISGFLILRDGGGSGQPSPTEATTAFLNAVYLEKNPTKAARYVCSAARNLDSLKRKIAELTAYETKFDRSPRFTVDPPTVETTAKSSAKVATTVHFTTEDERVAQQRLRILAVQDSGWYVCDVQTVT